MHAHTQLQTHTLNCIHMTVWPRAAENHQVPGIIHECVPACVSRSKLPQTQMEWAQLLEAQQRYHDAELQKWREIIKSSVVLLDQVQTGEKKKTDHRLVCSLCSRCFSSATS